MQVKLNTVFSSVAMWAFENNDNAFVNGYDRL